MTAAQHAQTQKEAIALVARMGETNTNVNIAYRAIQEERERCSNIAKRVCSDAQFYGNEEMRKAASLIRCRIETAG